jgi:hypothetical protein
MPSLAEHGPLGPPPILGDDDCKDLDTIKAVLQDHALKNGYAINVNCSTAIKAAWVCSKMASTIAAPRIRMSQRINAERPVR